MTKISTFALAAALLGSISLPALAQGPNAVAPLAKPAISQTTDKTPAGGKVHSKGTTVNAPVHRIAGTTDATKPGATKPVTAKPGVDAKAVTANPATAAPAKPATGAATMGTTAPAIKTN